jgi:hypothetical protein
VGALALLCIDLVGIDLAGAPALGRRGVARA